MKKIYKYVTPERIDVIENCTIRLTQPKYLNDPFDAILSFKKIVDKELFMQHFNGEKLFEKIITKNQNNGTKISLENLLALQNKNYEDFKSYFINEINNFNNLFTTENIEIKNLLKDEINKFLGVISFTESPNNIPMWAYYADVYKGFVIIFNSEHKFFNSGLVVDKDFGYLQKVNYCPEKTVLDSLKKLKGNPFFEKHIRWINEEEWRMILPLSFANTTKFPDIFLIDIPPEIIGGIIFGFRSDPKLVAAEKIYKAIS